MEEGEPSGLAAAYEGLTIVDDDEGVVVEVEEVAEPVVDVRFSAVGRVVTDRPVKFVVLRDVMSTAWRPARGVHVSELGSQRFKFKFFHETDITRVIDNGPWTFDQNLVVLHRLTEKDDPLEVSLDQASFWVQIHNLPKGFMSTKVAVLLGNSIGVFEADDPRNFERGRKTFMRVRIKLDVTKPLKAKLKLKKPGGEWFWVDLRYERLPSFCFLCGIMGHGDKFCPNV